MSKQAETTASRRDFLKMVGAGTPAAAAAAVVTGGTTAEAAEPDLSSDNIQDTAHTRAYFDSARF